jgi:DNA-binding transcriptional LysR family regulator
MLTSIHAIELRHLRYFVAVFDELHFGRAAQRLHIAQPPLSRAIGKLERDLGVQLLVRNSRAVRATPAGEAFAEEARKVLAHFDYAVTQARRAGESSPAVSIGCTRYLPVRRLQLFLGALRERHGDLRAQVRHVSALEQLQLLRAGELDLGIMTYSEEYDDLEWASLFPGEPLAVYLPREHALTAKEVLTPQDLTEETQLFFPRLARPLLYDYFLRLFDSAGYRFRSRYESSVDDPSDILLAVADGLGVALAPFSLKELSEAGAQVARRPTDPPLAMPDTIIVWRRKAPARLQPRLAEIHSIAAELRGSFS